MKCVRDVRSGTFVFCRMKAVGITAEYNPFHNGHAYHTEQARERSGADCVIAVMSGDFTQRGEPAVCGKWERARAAVSTPAGPDLVFELPYAFACGRAPVFARGAVDLLVRLGAGCISFGCEAEDPEELRTLAAALAREEAAIEAARASYMKEGISSAKAYELAVSELVGRQAAELLLAPNNILAVEYLKRILFWRERGHSVEDLPVRRYGSGYHEAADGSGQGLFAGGGALRKMIEEGQDISRYVPERVRTEDTARMSANYLLLLKGVINRSTPEELSRVCGVGEGMQNSIIRQTRKAGDLDALLTSLTSRRYPQAAVRRTLTHILTGAGWEEIDRMTGTVPGAARLLAAAEPGRAYLRHFGADDFCVVTNINKAQEQLEAADAERMRMDERAADLYNLLCGKDLYAASDRVRTPYIR